jgi:hypothetical protein
MSFWLYLVFVGVLGVPVPPFISSVTASGDFSTPNHMLQFDPNNVSNTFNDISYEYYEDTIARAYDPVTRRWFLLLEQADVVVFDAVNLTFVGQISLSQFSIQIPESMHFDPPTNTLWFVYLAFESTPGQYCGLSATPQEKGAKLIQAPSCYSFSGDYSYLIDASAFDVSSGMIWTQLPSMKSGQDLLGFNVRTKALTTPVPMLELCQDMRVAMVNKTSTLVCIRFVTNDIVAVDTATGHCTRLVQLPPLHDPIHTTAITVPSADGTTSSFFVQLQGIATYQWVEIDLLSAEVLHNSSTLINKHLPLAMTIYVSK